MTRFALAARLGPIALAACILTACPAPESAAPSTGSASAPATPNEEAASAPAAKPAEDEPETIEAPETPITEDNAAKELEKLEKELEAELGELE
jgi:hypothetical protein